MNTFYNVQFPKLNIVFKINPIAFTVFGVPVYWYGILVGSGFFLGFVYSLNKAKKYKIDQNKLVDVSVFSIVASIIGARLYYVLFCSDFNYYFKNPIKFFSLREGGIAVYGGMIAAIFSAFFLCKAKKLNFLKVLDVSSFGILIGQSIGRWGNFFNQEAFGTKTDGIFGMSSEATNNIAVHPCFLYESIWCAIGFFILEIINKKQHKNLSFFYATWYGLGRFFIESLRTDSLFVPGTNLRVSQVVSLMLAITGIIGILKNVIKTTDTAKL